MDEATESMIADAYKTVEKMLKNAVTGAKTKDQFNHNLRYCQIVGERMLGILVYNSAIQNKTDFESELAKVKRGIDQEIKMLVEASKDEKNMSMVEGAFDAPPIAEGAH